MLRDCILEFGGSWDAYLPLAEFAYNNSFQSSIQMSSYKAVYGRRCRSPIERFEAGETNLLGPDLVQEVIDKSVHTGISYEGRDAIRKRVFHVPMPKEKCISDSSQVLEAPTIPLDEKLTYKEELMVIVDRQVRKLRSKEIVVVEVLWRNHTIEEATWKVEDDI
ncbi:uncharacterized protein [Nicotiana sylvestris]|uniref:uncharacterized protein n=1 Tax=Nicotiana sylvestris TaxID=4096 RepID=UPI00388C4FCF